MGQVQILDFVGEPSEMAWSRMEQWQVSQTAVMCFVFSVSGLKASATGHEIVAHLRSRKPTSLQELYELLLHFITLAQERGASLSFAAGSLGKTKSGWISFDGQVLLRRGDTFGTITSGVELEVRSGAVRKNDMYVLTTRGGIGLVDEIKALMSKGFEVEGVVPTLDKLLRTHPHSDQTALCILRDLPEDAHAELVKNAHQPAIDTEVIDSAVNSARSSSLLSVTTATEEMSSTPKSSSGQELFESSSATHANPKQTLPPPEQKAPPSAVPSRPLGKRIRVWALALLTLGRRANKTLFQLGAKIGNASKSLWAHSRRVVISLYARVFKQRLTSSPDGAIATPTAAMSRKKLLVIIIGVVLGIVAVSLLITGYNLWQRSVTAEAEGLVQPYVSRLEQASQMARLDPVRAREQLTLLEADLRAVQAGQTPGTAKRQVVDTTLGDVETTLNQVVGSLELSTVPVWLDVQAQAPSFVTSNVTSIPGSMVIEDSQQQKAFLVDLVTAQATEINLAEIPKSTDLAIHSPEEMFTLGGGIYQVSLPDGTTKQLKAEGDSDRDGTLINSFSTYVYVFNPVKRNIYRYIIKDGKLSDPIGWLVSPLGVAADTVYDMAVDGDVWLTTKNGEVKKFSSGRSTSFQLSDLPDSLEGPLSIIAQADQTYLYIFVPNQGRVVVVTKDGNFVKQIKSSVLSGATGVAVDEAQNQLFAVSGSVIYQVPIL